MLEAVITLSSAGLITLLGLFVYYKSSHELIRQWFFAFCLALTLWQLAYWFSNIQSGQALLFNRLTFVGPTLAAVFFLLFVRYLYVGQSQHVQARQSLYVGLGVVAGFVGVTVSLLPGGVVAGIYPSFSGSSFSGYNITHGPLYLLFVATYLILALLITKLLLGLQAAKDAATRHQARIVLAGVVLAISTGLFTNVFLPTVLHSSQLSFLGSIAVLIMVGVLSIAIVRYKLIDVRMFVARAIAYALFLSIVALVYVLTVFILTSYIFGIHLSVPTFIIVALPAVIIGLTFGGVKDIFRRTTDRLFFQDLYDTQSFLDQLNRVLVGNIEIENLLNMCSKVIADNLRAEDCVFVIKEGAGGVRVVGTKKKRLDIGEITSSWNTHAADSDVVVADALPPEAGRFRRLLTSSEVAVLARVVPRAEARRGVEQLGYIVLGPKLSGNQYTTKDAQLLGIIANELVIAIQNALRFEEIQRFNATLQEEVDTATRKLKRQNKRLEELDDIKDDFISMASHQLRTPLTSVKGYLSMVLEGDAGKLTPTEKQMLKQAFASSQRMVFLITDLLNVSRLKTGKFVIDAAPTNLKDVVQEELDQLHETAEAKSLKLTFKAPQKFPELMLDDVKIRQVIMNFVDNAIYYTPSGGRIRVELEEKPTTVELRVVDNGIGVPRSEQHHLFTKFYRAANARKARPDGTGLGLFMAQKVIIAQGGSIIFHSKEGQGSTFGFSFSKSRLAVRKQPDPAGEPVKPAPEHATV